MGVGLVFAVVGVVGKGLMKRDGCQCVLVAAPALLLSSALDLTSSSSWYALLLALATGLAAEVGDRLKSGDMRPKPISIPIPSPRPNS